MKNDENGRQRGFSLIGALIVSAITTAVLTYSLKSMNSLSFSAKHLNSVSQLESIRMILSRRVDCDQTFALAGITTVNRALKCQSTSTIQVQPYFQLSDSNGRLLGTDLSTSGKSKGSVRIGSWRIRASCSESEQSLIVRAAMISNDDKFLKNSKNNSVYNWSNVRGLLFGGSKAFPLCFDAKETTSPAELSEFIMSNSSGGDPFPITIKKGPTSSPLPYIRMNTWPEESSSHLAGEFDTSKIRGARCNESEGWRILSCTLGSSNRQDSDILRTKNGCLTTDFFESPATNKTELRIICVK